MIAAQHAKQERTRKRPLVFDRCGRQIERLSGLVHAESCEVPQRDDLGLSRVGAFELSQRFVHRNKIGKRRIGTSHGFIEFDVFTARTVFGALVMARTFDQDAPHRQCRGGKKVTTPIPLLCRPVARDAQERLVHERRRLQGLVRLALASETCFREFAQLVVDFRQKLAGGSRTAVVFFRT